MLAVCDMQQNGIAISIDGHNAIAVFDESIQMYRGEFADLSGGGTVFYAETSDQLLAEAKKSLQIFNASSEAPRID